MATHKGGRGKCAACSHESSEALNEALLLGTSLRKLGKTYGISAASLGAHKAHHLSPAMATVRRVKTAKGMVTAVSRMEAIVTRVERHVTAAEKSKNTGLALVALGKLQDAVVQLAKLTGEYTDRPTTVINIQTSDEWIKTRTALLLSLIPYPDAARAVSNALAKLDKVAA